MRRVLLLAVPLALLIAGCSKPEAAFLGKWQANPPPKTGNARTDAMIASVASSMILEFKADRTVSLAVPNKTISGTFVVSDKVATVTMTPSANAQPAVQKPLSLTLSADGKTLSAEGDGPQMTFSKVAG